MDAIINVSQSIFFLERESLLKGAVQLNRVHTVECKVCLYENDFLTP